MHKKTQIKIINLIDRIEKGENRLEKLANKTNPRCGESLAWATDKMSFAQPDLVMFRVVNIILLTFYD